MGTVKVLISKGGYAFSRYILAVLIWMSLLLKQKELLLIVLVFLLLAVVLKLRRSPLVVFYDNTIGRLFPSKQVGIDEDGLGSQMPLAASSVWFVLDFFTSVRQEWAGT